MNRCLFISFILFSMWDYYIPTLGGRVFDYIGLLFVAMELARRILNPVSFTLSRVQLFVLMIMFPSVVIGYWAGDWLTATAFLVGATIVCHSFSAAPFNRDRFERQIAYLLTVNLLFFFFQYVAFKFAGTLVDYHSFLGSLDPRTFNVDTDFFRAAGLFQEPNSFCLALFMLSVLRMVSTQKPIDILFFASLAAVVLSESLWGIGAGIVLVFLAIVLARSTVFVFASLIALGAVASVLFASLGAWTDALEAVLSPTTVMRLADLSGDPSAEARYGGNLSLGVQLPLLLLGQGLSTHEFQSFAGANGLGFLVYSFGLIGAILFMTWLAIDLRSNRLPILIAVLFALTSYPLFTYAYWWAWLALLIQATRATSERTSSHSAATTIASISPTSAAVPNRAPP